MPTSRFVKGVLLPGVIGCSAWLQYLIDDGLGIGWPQNVVRNWEQIGFLKLHGKLVANPGGFEAVTNPDVYKGMSPVSLYPAYFAGRAFGWTGLGTLSFHILLALAVFWAVWRLLGRDDFAFGAAAAAVLCPGYGRWQKILDPNDIAVLIGLPYVTLIISILRKPRLNVGAFAGLFALTLAFTAINWTAAWVLALCALLLLGLPHIKRRNAFLFILLAGASSSMVVIGSVMAKAGAARVESGGGSVGLVQLIGVYGWGDAGYGAGMTTGKAALRLFTVNGVGLLPLLVIWGWAAANYYRRDVPNKWFAMSPVLLACAEIAVMRNYFAHHPWMAAPVLLAGVVFSLALMRAKVEGTMPVDKKNLFLPAVSLLCVIYGLTVTMFARANETNFLSLVNLIRHHTERSDCIVIPGKLDPDTARLAARFDEVLDRRVKVADDLGHLPQYEGRTVILTSLPLSGAANLLAQSSSDERTSRSWLHRTADWFNHAIARRRPGDRMELADTYFLYEEKR